VEHISLFLPFYYRGQIYQIARVDALRRPVMYKLKDLLGDSINGRYYKEQLKKAPTPGKDFDFEVNFNFENVLFRYIFFGNRKL